MITIITISVTASQGGPSLAWECNVLLDRSCLTSRKIQQRVLDDWLVVEEPVEIPYPYTGGNIFVKNFSHQRSKPIWKSGCVDLCKVIRELDKVACSLLADLGISVEGSGVIEMEMLVQGVTELHGVLDGLTSTLADLVLVPLWMCGWGEREGLGKLSLIYLAEE